MRLIDLHPVMGMSDFAGGCNQISIDCPICGPPFQCTFYARLGGAPNASIGLWSWTGLEEPYWEKVTVTPSIDFSNTSAHGKKRICKVHFSITDGEVTIS